MSTKELAKSIKFMKQLRAIDQVLYEQSQQVFEKNIKEREFSYYLRTGKFPT